MLKRPLLEDLDHSEDSYDSKQALTSPAKNTKDIFEELAISLPEFKRIGIIICGPEDPKCKENSIRFNSMHYSTKYQRFSSGVYLQDQIVLTAAHPFHSKLKNEEFISSLTEHTYFITEDNQFARVIMASFHPGYVDGNLKLKNDLALLLLDRSFKNMGPIKINYTPVNQMNDVIVVGYTNENISAPTSTIRKPMTYGEIRKKATKLSSMYYDSDNMLQISKIGFSREPYTYCCGLFSSFQFQEHPFDPLEAGVYHGMSGGGFFFKNALHGIATGYCDASYTPITPGYSRVRTDNVTCTPLFNYKKWIDKTIASYNNLLPKLMLQSEKWYADREAYEKKHNQKDNMSEVTIQTLKLSLIHLHDTHFKTENGRMKEILNDFIAIEEFSIEDIKDLLKELIAKKYSLSGAAIFSKNKGIEADIDKNIHLVTTFINKKIADVYLSP